MSEQNVAQAPVEQAQSNGQVQEGALPLPHGPTLEARLAEMEGFLSERDKEIASLKQSLEQLQGEGKSLSLSLSDKDQAIARTLKAYRQSITEANPDIPEELLSGDTLEAFQDSLGKARALVQKIREQVKASSIGFGGAGVPPVPAGAPVRSGPDLSALSPREKIVHGLKGK